MGKSDRASSSTGTDKLFEEMTPTKQLLVRSNLSYVEVIWL